MWLCRDCDSKMSQTLNNTNKKRKVPCESVAVCCDCDNVATATVICCDYSNMSQTLNNTNKKEKVTFESVAVCCDCDCNNVE